jgi:phosphate transport system permease protein
MLRKKITERVIEGSLKMSAMLTILTTVAILWVLISESMVFFKDVSVWHFLTGTRWTPLYESKQFGILPLLTGTMLTTFIAVAVALPLGLTIAIYLSEYAKPGFRRTVKPLLEVLAAVPTVVYGYFALMTVTPALKVIIPDLQGFNSLSAGIVMGIMIIPLISSLSEDAMQAVPKSLREASFGMGATRFQTSFKVVVPAAFSGVVVSVILAISRAVGETMIVAIAAGQQPRLTFDPTVAIETITTFIVQVSLGDVAHGSIEYQTIFAAGITLFVFTFALNNVSFWLKKRFRESYE